MAEMIELTVYRISDGKIMRSVRCRYYDRLEQAMDGELIHEGELVDPELFYFPGGVKTPRPLINLQPEYHIVADGVDAVDVVLPPSVIVDLDLKTWTEDDTEFFFSTEIPGTFRFRVEPAFPYQMLDEVVIHAS